VDGTQNDAFGDLALTANLASNNTAMGDDALFNNTIGDGNTAVGREAGDTIIDGNDNVCIGHFAGAGIVDASNSIAIGVQATGPFANSDNTCWIGSIDGRPTSDAGSTVAVMIDSNNVLGTTPSSRRYKRDINPMDKASEVIPALKPVTFKYNHDVKGTPCFGLIAEDVAVVARREPKRRKRAALCPLRRNRSTRPSFRWTLHSSALATKKNARCGSPPAFTRCPW